MSELMTKVVRKHGAEKIHVVDAPAELFGRYRWIGSPFTGIALPLATKCGVMLRGQESVAVCMRPGTRVTCVQCRRLAGIERAGDGNSDYPGGPAAAAELDSYLPGGERR